ncbi:hypothetical protein MHYP_G00093510 [Metynnis hypsauchen]
MKRRVLGSSYNEANLKQEAASGNERGSCSSTPPPPSKSLRAPVSLRAVVVDDLIWISLAESHGPVLWNAHVT